jgi:hypothetical protein
MIEADFEQDTITFKMHGQYHARHGTYIILPVEEYEDLKRNQKENVDFIEQMRRAVAP